MPALPRELLRTPQPLPRLANRAAACANVSGGPRLPHPHDRKDNPTNDPAAKTTAQWPGIEETAGLLNLRIAEGHGFGYAIPMRSSETCTGCGEQLVGQLRPDQDARTVRVDRLVDEARTRQEGDADSTPVPGSPSRAALKDELGHLRRSRGRRPPGRASARQARTRREFRDHAGQSGGCMVCADLDADQPCYAAVARGLRAREEAGR